MPDDSNDLKPKNGFWAFVEKQTGRYGFTSAMFRDLNTEGILQIDQGAWVSFRSLGPRRWLSFGRGDYGVVALTCQRLLVRADSFVLIDLAIDSYSFQDLKVELTNTAELKFSPIDITFPLSNNTARDQVLTVKCAKSKSLFDLIRLAQTNLEAFDSQFCTQYLTHDEQIGS